MGKSDKAGARMREIAIVHYPGVQMAAVLGLFDLLQFAATQIEPRDRAPSLWITQWACPDAASPPQRLDCPAPDTPESWPTALVLPPALGPLFAAETAPDLTSWIAQAHAKGCIAASACAGAFVLAQAGLLDRRPATTHWAYDATFRARFPQVQLDTDQLLVDDGDIITAGGIMAWTDLGLCLIDRFLGVDAMLTTARAFLIDPPGRMQSHYRAFVPCFDHGDAAVLKAQRWLHDNQSASLQLEALALVAGLEPRTLQRRFFKATGMSPAAYNQHLRIARAQDLLLTSDLSTDEVAWASNYRDVASFRKVFLRRTGTTPADYRRKFRRHGLRPT